MPAEVKTGLRTVTGGVEKIVYGQDTMIVGWFWSGTMMWHIVKEYCNHGCNEVVLIKTARDSRILAFCQMCGAAWLSPIDLSKGNYVICSERVPGGVLIPTMEEGASSEWASQTVKLVPESKYLDVRAMNEQLARERIERGRSAKATGVWDDELDGPYML